jgi:glycosyltransferase involved in cell wall biosynthesis
MPEPPRVLFLGSGFAGHRTRFENLLKHTRGDPRIRPMYRLVSGWRDGGLFERVPGVPRSVRGRARSLSEALALLRIPRPDITWTAAITDVRLLAPLHIGPLRRPLVLDQDCAAEIYGEWSEVYFGRPQPTGVRRRLRDWLDARLMDNATMWTAWSQWAADSLVQCGAREDQVVVLPPGVDLELWTLPVGGRQRPGERIRLLFVGGDFVRKGGDLLLDAFRSTGGDQFELDIVTRDAVPETPNVRVHRTEANSPLLRSLYDRADVFVMPSLAECFGIATVEAMASGLPVIVGNTGAGSEIVGPDAGWVVAPEVESVSAALNAAWEAKDRLPAIGERGRRRVEEHFDGAANDRRVVDLVLEAHKRGTRGGGP